MSKKQCYSVAIAPEKPWGFRGLAIMSNFFISVFLIRIKFVLTGFFSVFHHLRQTSHFIHHSKGNIILSKNIFTLCHKCILKNCYPWKFHVSPTPVTFLAWIFSGIAHCSWYVFILNWVAILSKWPQSCFPHLGQVKAYTKLQILGG